MRGPILCPESIPPRGRRVLWGVLLIIGIISYSPLWSKEAEKFKLPDRLGPGPSREPQKCEGLISKLRII